ncbi:MAG: serine hydrolase domain-containing protein, partial [Chitinophagales bacterium]
MNKTKGKIIAAFGVFALTFLFIGCYGQTKSDKIDQLINTYAKYGQFNGSVLISEKGEIIYKKGFGLANVEWNIPNQPDTKHRLASMTKQFTAMLILQLVSENKLKLQVPISAYLPDYPKKTGDIITIHQLLTHTSGIPNYTDFASYRDIMRDPYRPEELVDLFADSSLQFTPGEKFSYSNSGYILLGFIIEKITGKNYEQVLQEKILTPLKMNNTGYDHANTIIKNRASGYYKVGNNFQNAGYIDMSTPFAAGAIYSTVEDLYLWDQALYTEKLLPDKYRDLLFGKYIPESERSYYGYGWSIGEMPVGNTKEQLQTISHSGFINGFNTLITRIPSDKSLIVLLSNAGGAPLDQMTIAINGILYNKPYNFPKKSIAYSMMEVIEKDGITTALSYFKAIKDSDSYYLSESEMNDVGYQLLQSGKAKEAAAVFKLNVEAYPNSFNVYD